MLGGFDESAYSERSQEVHEFPYAELLERNDRRNVHAFCQGFGVGNHALEILRIVLGFVTVIFVGFVRNGKIENRILGPYCEIPCGQQINEGFERGSGLSRSKCGIYLPVLAIGIARASDHDAKLVGCTINEDYRVVGHVLPSDFRKHAFREFVDVVGEIDIESGGSGIDVLFLQEIYDVRKRVFAFTEIQSFRKNALFFVLRKQALFRKHVCDEFEALPESFGFVIRIVGTGIFRQDEKRYLFRFRKIANVLCKISFRRARKSVREPSVRYAIDVPGEDFLFGIFARNPYRVGEFHEFPAEGSGLFRPLDIANELARNGRASLHEGSCFQVCDGASRDGTKADSFIVPERTILQCYQCPLVKLRNAFECQIAVAYFGIVRNLGDLFSVAVEIDIGLRDSRNRIGKRVFQTEKKREHEKRSSRHDDGYFFRAFRDSLHGNTLWVLSPV